MYDDKTDTWQHVSESFSDRDLWDWDCTPVINKLIQLVSSYVQIKRDTWKLRSMMLSRLCTTLAGCEASSQHAVRVFLAQLPDESQHSHHYNGPVCGSCSACQHLQHYVPNVPQVYKDISPLFHVALLGQFSTLHALRGWQELLRQFAVWNSIIVQKLVQQPELKL